MSAPEHVDASWLAVRLAAGNARELGRGLTQLIDGGELAPGAQLPTIREFAKVAGVSPGTVMSAWSRVRETGRLETRRRGGTVVAGVAKPVSGRTGSDFEWPSVEMSLVTPDPGLQPDLRVALATALGTKDLHAAQRAYITARLLQAVQGSWPFPAQAWNCVGGGSEALVLASAAAVHGDGPGARLIAVEEPVSPGYLDILRHLGIEPVGVRADDQGPTVQSVAGALDRGVAALVLQPSGAYAVSGALTATRAAELASVLAARATGTWVIEDDSAGPLATDEPATLGDLLPDRVVRIRSYCKAFGIDLRSAVLGGCEELVERTIRLRSFGMASNSRILQNSLAGLIEDEATTDVMRRARAAYRRRREALLTAFAGVGLSASSGRDGFVVWVRVPDETAALINLARKGIVVASGGSSFINPSAGLLRVSILQLPDDPDLIDGLAKAVRAAIHSADREYFD